MPYYIIYLQNAGLHIDFASQIGFDSYVIIMAPAIIVAAVFHKSSKTDTGTLESKTCFKGLCKKQG